MNTSPDLAKADQDTRQPENPFVFADEFEIFKTLNTKHRSGELTKCQLRRELRRNRVNVQEMREATPPLLLADETIIPDRTIEMNIANEKPTYLQYIEQPQTVISFFDSANPSINFTQVDSWVTDLCRYQSWKTPWLKLIDSILLHGAGYLEVVFDKTMPGRFVFEYIRRDDLLFPDKTKEIKHCSRFARRYELTKLQFEQHVKEFGFDEYVAEAITKHYKNREEFIEIFKYFLRGPDNILYISWQAPDVIAPTDWLKAPEPHFLGDFELLPPAVDLLKGVSKPRPPAMLPTSVCPIIEFPYTLEEDETLKEIQGRAALDAPAQSAIQGTLSATVNSATRASKLLVYQKPGPTGETSDKPISLIHGHVAPADLGILQTPWPNAIALSVAQTLSVRNAQQLGQTDFSAMTRQDTAKRAAEIHAAQAQADLLKSTKISLFAQSSLQAYSIGWNIIKNQIKIGGLQPPPGFLPQLFLSPTLTLTMSADAQVVKKAALDAKYLQYYPLTAGTKLQAPYFNTMMQRLFPEEFPLWAQQGAFISEQEQLLSEVFNFMMMIPANQIPAEMRQPFLQLMDKIQAVIMPAPTNNGPAEAAIA